MRRRKLVLLADGGEEDDVPESVGRRYGDERKEEEPGRPEKAGENGEARSEGRRIESREETV